MVKKKKKKKLSSFHLVPNLKTKSRKIMETFAAQPWKQFLSLEAKEQKSS